MKTPIPLFKTTTSSVCCLLAIYFTFSGLISQAQAITQLYTDYNGYYTSGAGAALNTAIKPSKSHNLLGFSYNNLTYSTGVNDSTLIANGVIPIACHFKAVPATAIGGTVSTSTYILTPALDDGVANGTLTPYPSLKILDALTDGINGLNIGSGVTNLPTTVSMTFPVSSIDVNAIADSKPDIVYTQIAAIGGNPDTLFFVTPANVGVGTPVLVRWNMISLVGNHVCDLYTLNAVSCDNATINGVNATAQSKDFRLVAYQLSEFGITAANAGSVAKLIIKPGGDSDPAFVAYNVDAFTVQTTLPTRLTSLTTTAAREGILLRFSTASEAGTAYFTVEKSTTGQTFSPVGTISAAGYSTSPQNYSFTDATIPGNYYYRVHQVDRDGKTAYSKVVAVAVSFFKSGLSVYPNPASGAIRVDCPKAASGTQLLVVDVQGATVWGKQVSAGSTSISISAAGLRAGVYQVILRNGGRQTSTPLLIQ